MSGRQALMLHGAGGGGWEWNIWRGVWSSRGWRCHAPDLLPASGGLAATSLCDYQRQVQDWARELSRPWLVGASLGGLLALNAAQKVDCAGVVLINPVPPLPEVAETGLSTKGDDDIRPWGRGARLHSTRSAMGGADDAAALYAFRRWRDESAGVLREIAAGIHVERLSAPVLLIASRDDADIPFTVSQQLAHRLGAQLLACDGDHLQPLMGRTANRVAALAVDWLNAQEEFRAD